MKKIFVNFLNLNMATNLGVSKYTLALIKILKSSFDIYALIEDQESRASELGGKIAREVKAVLTTKEAREMVLNQPDCGVEVLVHHFKRGVLPIKRIVICHDLHVFDVPWKYENIEKHVQNMKVSITEADAVVCHFPRAYYALERAFGITKASLFLTPEILMIDTRIPSQQEVKVSLEKFGLTGKWGKYLFYPAQLQKHKGHDALIKALADKKVKDGGLKIVFCGSDFDASYTAELKKMVQDAGVGDQCRFLGRVSEVDLSALLSGSSGVVVPSRAEGGALVALEGVYFNKPIAVNRIPAAEMHLQMYQAKCRWFQVDKQESLVAALLDLWQPAADSPLLGDNAKARALIVDKTKEKVIAEGWTKVISYLCAGESKPFPCVDSNRNVFRYI